MKALYLIIILFISNYTFAASPTIYAIHINGIDTSPNQANVNLEAIQRTAPQNNTNMVVWTYLYNNTHGLWDDLSDVFNQKAQEKKNITLDDFVVAYMKANDLHAESGTTEYEFIKQSIKDDFINDPQYSGRNLESIVTEFNQLVPDRENSYILLLPHSQGNLYANQLYNYLTSTGNYDSQQLRIFGIATPANEISGSGDYVTSSNDLVINGLRLITSILPSNITVNFSLSDVLGHNLIDIYLTDPTSKEIIKQKITQALDTLAHYLELSIPTGYFKLSDYKKYYDTIGYASIPVTVMRDENILYSNNELVESGFYYYFANSPIPLIMYPLTSGKYSINVSTDNNYTAGSTLDVTIQKPQNSQSLLNYYYCYNNYTYPSIRECTLSKITNSYPNTLNIIEFNYLNSDLSLIRKLDPPSFKTNNLMTLENFIVN